MLDSWLLPVNTDTIELPELQDFQLGKNIATPAPAMADLSDIQVAIIGLDAQAATAARRHLYQTAYHFTSLRIADLGDIRKPEANFIAPFVQELLEGKIIPVLIGVDSGLMSSQFFAHKAVQASVNVAWIDARIPFTPKAEVPMGFLDEIMRPRNSGLLHLTVAGYQTHFVNPATLAYLDKHHFDHVRLGRARTELPALEPLLRDADTVGFDISAIRQAEAPGQAKPGPNGFFAEEACQICRYAGMSDKLRSFGIFGFTPANDAQEQTAQLVAQMVWYFLEGVANRKNDFPASLDGLVEYVVDTKEDFAHLSFWKSTRSGRWWVQVPVKTRKKEERHRLLPCTYEDYLQASNDELPSRLWNAFKRFG
jgi:formiminoglutamase